MSLLLTWGHSLRLFTPRHVHNAPNFGFLTTDVDFSGQALTTTYFRTWGRDRWKRRITVQPGYKWTLGIASDLREGMWHVISGICKHPPGTVLQSLTNWSSRLRSKHPQEISPIPSSSRNKLGMISNVRKRGTCRMSSKKKASVERRPVLGANIQSQIAVILNTLDYFLTFSSPCLENV